MSTRIAPVHGASALNEASPKENFISSAILKFVELVSARCEPYVSIQRMDSPSTCGKPRTERATTVIALDAGVTRTVAFVAIVPSSPSFLTPIPIASADDPIQAAMFSEPTPRAAFFDTGFVRKPTAPASTLTRGTLKCTMNGALRTLARPSLPCGKAATGSIASPTSSPLSSRTKMDTCSPSNSFSDAIDKARVCPMFAQIPPKPVGTGDFECTVLLVSPKVIVVTGVPAILDAAPSTDTSMRCKKTYDSARNPNFSGGPHGRASMAGDGSSLFGIDSSIAIMLSNASSRRFMPLSFIFDPSAVSIEIEFTPSTVNS
mmetsp:Transcript_4179/g.16089  ORF Transcript_4179/g.16089 Transcript_4179/m.16089 type:complete len:318 (-) Transcript_4179:877-1830(-)